MAVHSVLRITLKLYASFTYAAVVCIHIRTSEGQQTTNHPCCWGQQRQALATEHQNKVRFALGALHASGPSACCFLFALFGALRLLSRRKDLCVWSA